jgi:hypothetical protein
VIVREREEKGLTIKPVERKEKRKKIETQSFRTGGGGEGCEVSANEYSCAHGAQINL